MAYAELPDVRLWLGTTTEEDNALLQILLIRSQAMIEQSFGGLVFEASADATRYYTPGHHTRGSELMLDYPLYNITSITNGDGHALTGSEYTTSPKVLTGVTGGRPHYKSIKLLWSSGLMWEADSNGDPEDAIAIVGRWAYGSTVHPSVAHATVRLAAYLYRQRASGDVDRPAVTESGIMLLPGTLPKDVKEILSAIHNPLVVL